MKRLSFDASAAAGNLTSLASNVYPGRGLVFGLSANKQTLIQLCWTMGRSFNSQNRVYVPDGGRVRTAFADPGRGGDPSLVIYDTMLEAPGAGIYVVSNGHQTNTVLESMSSASTTPSKGFEAGLKDWQYEPDKPNYTPRITGAFSVGSACCLDISILKVGVTGDCQRDHVYSDELHPGYGFCLHTYQGDGDVLPSFEGEPYTVPLDGNPDKILERFWSALNPQFRVSLALKAIDINTGESQVLVKNQYQTVS